MMERLTGRMENGASYVRSETGKEGVGHFTTQRRLPELISRLAKYEDTGLTPEQVREMKEKQIAKKPFINDYSLTCCPNCHGIEVLAGCESVELNHCNQCGQKLDWK